MALELLPVGHSKLSCTVVSGEACENVKGVSYLCTAESWELKGHTVKSFCERSFDFKLLYSSSACVWDDGLEYLGLQD